MTFKSVIIFITPLLVLISVTVFSLRRYGVLTFEAPWESAANEGDAAPTPDPPVAARAQALTRELTPVLKGLEGLALRLSRPLMFNISEVRGLAATAEFLYVASADPEKRLGLLSQVHRDTYTTAQLRVLKEGNRYRLGGIHIGPDGLWAPLAGGDQEGSTVILLINPRSLEEERSFEVGDRIRAVAQTADGHIYGVNEGATLFYEWDAAGRQLRQIPNMTATSYYDMEVVRGSLVCAGEARDLGVGVVDVIEPGPFIIVARHHCYVRSTSHNWVTQGGFAFAEGVFFFLPDEGKMPLVMTYVLDGGTLEQYVPGVG